ncbi:MAG: DNA polymerase III subunit psi [Arsenophonus sp.]
MTTVKDKLLKYMGIIQWTLRNSTIPYNEHIISISNHIKLAIIADELIDLSNTFVKDILLAMRIDSHQVCCLLAKEISLLPKKVIWPCWILGKQLQITSEKWIIYTLPLEKIYSSHELKRIFLLKIYQNENNLKFK